MNGRASIRSKARHHALISLTLALLPNGGCTPGEASETLYTLGGELTLQLATFLLM